MGVSRSGTTALVDYLNQHEQILVCMERYKFVQENMDPSLLTFERILDYEPGRGEGYETDIPREHHAELLAGKDPAKLKWIGDKKAASEKRYRETSENNPGAHFLITYRPIEEVVESFEDRAKNPNDPWIGGKDALKTGVELWNRAMRSTRKYLQSQDEPNGLIVSYHDFFSRPADYAPLLSEFLELDFDGPILETWQETSREFKSRWRDKQPLTEEQMDYIRENKDHEVEEWMLERIARQWSEPGLYKQTVGQERGRQRFAAALTRQKELENTETKKMQRIERRIERLQEDLAAERNRAAAAERRHQNLDTRMKAVQSSRSWELLQGIGHIRSAVGRSAKR